MLRIKDEINLEKLEEFGFKEYPNGFFKKIYIANDDDDRVCYKIDKNSRIIRITRINGELDDTLYDLIQADLVEKVKEEKV